MVNVSPLLVAPCGLPTLIVAVPALTRSLAGIAAFN